MPVIQSLQAKLLRRKGVGYVLSGVNRNRRRLFLNLHEQNKPPPFPFLLNMFMHTYSTLLPDVQGQQPQTDQSGLHRNFTSPGFSASRSHCLRRF